jgi:signal transduction histidine kinase
MPESWKELFAPEFFMPHGHCYLWKPGLVWLQVLSNGSIALAYISIFATLVYLVRRISGMPFQRMYLAFAVFIVSCGFTHVFDIIVIWDPAYWLDGSMRAVTAVASLGTAVLLPPLVPKAVGLAEAARLSHERGVQLEAANRDMAVLLEKTKELEQLKTQFFANVSHELRTPLALILGPAESLANAWGSSETERRHARLIASNARALLKHVNDLLDISKLEARKVAPDYAEADVGHVVRSLAANFDGVARDRSISYRVDASDLRAQVDTGQLERVTLNLLSNAFKFTPAGGVIRCSLRAPGTDLFVLEVADSGPGVPPEHRGVIFERFRQADGGVTRKFGGTGLGLAIAKEFVELHGGTITVGEAPEGGAVFTVDLPRSAPAGARLSPAADPTPPPPELLRPVLEELGPRTAALPLPENADEPLVLVVEDNADMNRFVSEALSRDYRVVSAFNGQQGVDKAKELKPDLILTDMMMPELSGEQLVRRLRSDPAMVDIPVVLLTAKADDELRTRLLQEGASDYLMKPFSVEELRARIDNLVSTKRARDVLQRELDSRSNDLEALARQLAERKREVELAVTSLRVAREQAEHASQLKSNFLGLVSHELRTPITALQLQVERLQRSKEPKSERQSEILTRMSNASSRLGGLVESLLSYARISSGRLTTNLQTVDLQAIISDTVDELRPTADAKGLSLDWVAAASPSIHSDPQLIRLIVTNLIGNAIKFTESGGVKVELQRTEGAHRILVTDTGPGIPKHEHGRIFEAFEHIEPTRKKHTPGIGLGLTLVREMVGALGGEVDLESETGRGSTFIVTLPTTVEDGGARTTGTPFAAPGWPETFSS